MLRFLGALCRLDPIAALIAAMFHNALFSAIWKLETRAPRFDGAFLIWIILYKFTVLIFLICSG